MAFNINEELKRTFSLASLATLRKEAAKILNSQEWKEFQKIKKSYADQRRFEQRTYDLEYKTRVEVARKRLINKAGEKNKDFKHRWFGQDRFDKSAIQRQAHRHVKAQHTKLLAHLETKEAREVESLLDRSQHRRRLREKPKQDFNRAADRRKDIERRQSRPRSRSR